MSERFVDAIAKLIELTREGSIRWTPKAADESLKKDPQDRLGTVFEARHKGRNLRLYERAYRIAGVSPILRASGLFGEGDWHTVVLLEIVNDEGQVLWTFPQMNALRDLLASVRYQSAGVADFIDELLED